MGRQRIESRLERERCEDGLGKNFCSVAAIGAVAGVAGAAISAGAAGDAADAQSQASQQANQLQYQMHQENVALQRPTIDAGNLARDRLQQLLGLGAGTSGSRMVNGIASNASRDDVRNALLAQYTNTRTLSPTQNPYGTFNVNSTNYPTIGSMSGDPNNTDPNTTMGGTFTRSPGLNTYNGNNSDAINAPQSTYQESSVDEAGLNAAIDAWYKERDAQNAAIMNDPLYGSLAQRFEFDKYTPGTFSYTGEDLYNDPSYQFRLQQGQKALDRQGAAAGRFLSGSQLQAASNYNQGAASQEFQNAYNRALGTFNTNENNRANAFNTNEGNRFNAYQANFNNAVNPLLSLAGAATLGSQNLGAAGAATANAMGNNLTAAANATGAAGIAAANSINNGISNGISSYQSNNLLQGLLNNGNLNNNPISASNQNAFDSFGSGNNWWGTA